MIEVEKNVQVSDERGERVNEPGHCKFTIRGTRPGAVPGRRTGPDISTKQSRDVPPNEIFMGRYY
jgi:hypothetical protein